MILRVLACACLLRAPMLAAQNGPMNDAADSAKAARTAWSSAASAARNHQNAEALRDAQRASAAWPTQQAYIRARAVLSARAADTGTARAALEEYATLGLGLDLRDTVFDKFRSLDWFRGTAVDHAKNRTPLARSRMRAELADSTIWPEGVDFDSRSGKLYVTSIRHRTLVELSPDGTQRELWPRWQNGIGSVFAVRVDRRSGDLWVTTSGSQQMDGYAPTDSSLAALLRVRVSDGTILKRWDLPRVGRHTLGDVAVASNGDVWMSDSDEPVLYRLAAGSDTLERFTSPLFRSLQGVAPAPDSRTIYVADYSHGILRVDLGTRRITRVADAPYSTSLGCDGIVWYDDAIIAIQNGVDPPRVMRFRLDASGTHIVSAEVLDRGDSSDEPTIGTIVGNEFVYVMNSQWNEHADDGSLRPGVVLRRPKLLSLPLK